MHEPCVLYVLLLLLRQERAQLSGAQAELQRRQAKADDGEQRLAQRERALREVLRAELFLIPIPCTYVNLSRACLIMSE